MLFTILSYKGYSQLMNDSYMAQDTITIHKPIVIMVKGYDGKFILSEENLGEADHLEKAIKNHKIFLYNDDGIGFISSKDRQKNKVSIGDCPYIKREDKKNITILRLPIEVNQFYIGFIKLSAYNKRVISTNNQKTYLKDSDDFKPILYPICQDSEE